MYVNLCFNLCNFIGNQSNHTESEVADYNVSYSWPNFATAPKGSTVYTLNITIIPDKRLENNELFRVYVDEPKLPNGMIPIQADVIIMNDDGKLLYISFDCINLQMYIPRAIQVHAGQSTHLVF